MTVSARTLSEVEKSLTVAGYKEVVAGLCRNGELTGDKVSFSLFASRYVYLVNRPLFYGCCCCLFVLIVGSFSMVQPRIYVCR